MKRSLTRTLLAIAATALLGLPAWATLTITIETRLTNYLAEETDLGSTGDDLYELQEEGVHGTITDTTREEVPHDYVWICFGKHHCIPVDPPRLSN